MLSILLLVGILWYCNKKFVYFPSVLVLTSIIWVVLLQENQLKVGWIYLGSVLGILFSFDGSIDYLLLKNDTFIQIFIGLVVLCSVLFLSGMIIIKDHQKKGFLDKKKNVVNL